MADEYDAGLRVNGVLIFTDTTDEIEARMQADMAEDDAKDAIVAAAIRLLAYPVPVDPEYDALRAAVAHYETVRTHARPGGA